ncbi:helix-turn-helix domain-containing protein [Paraburkholderia bryophila]|uniref:helix-turn-helix domain-containing protein n=1 Tax=Paraburkholderia bryophila TaxID=420952 RepID=UPI00234B1E02|nr:helix-turn-helix domain-containing protein [Paraburkholderia bryophila]WCM23304.1 helix-turn-helix domain-containing protein [Paraburkholderia bryophila]
MQTRPVPLLRLDGHGFAGQFQGPTARRPRPDQTPATHRFAPTGCRERITQFRKARGVTQVQLAETLGVSQQTIQAYEVGRRRIQVSNLPVVARALAVSLEDLFGESDSSPCKRGPAPKWQKQIEAISKLPRAKQQFVSQMLDTVLAQAQH